MKTPSLQFFEIQRYRKRLSLIFYGLFVVVVLAHALVLLAVCALFAWFITDEIRLSWWLASLVGLALYFMLSMAIQRQRIRQGGQSLAKQLGAVRLFVSRVPTENSTQTPIYHQYYIQVNDLADFPSSYQRYYEFAEQLSLASGVSLPKLYVMPNEMGINAFVAGFDEYDTVMVLTQGALERLSNEALYGLIGHELGHILHGDARLNLKLYVMMAGLSLFYEMAEALERFIFGDFHADYHADTISDYQRNTLRGDMPMASNAAGDWALKYWAKQAPITKNDPLDEAMTALLLVKAPLLFVLMACYMLGLLGMASMHWLKGRFNHQRELLADATSMQLTRSFGIIELLETIGEQDTVLYTTKVSAMDYFFFANPSQDEHWFSSHPKTSERLLALHAHDYEYLGVAIVKHLDTAQLDQLYTQAMTHAPVLSLAEEIQTAQPEYFHQAYEHFDDVVDDDGRLVVDKAWLEGFDGANPTQAKVDDIKQELDWSLVNVDEPLWLYPRLANFSCDIKPSRLSDLPWMMVRTVRAPLGALAVLECLLLCRFEKINAKQAFGLQSIYLNLPNQLPDVPLLAHDGSVIGDTILPRVLDEALLSEVVRLNRHHDQIIIRQLLTALSNQLYNTPLSHTHQKQLLVYQAGLWQLFVTKQRTILAPLSKSRLRYKLDKLLQAVILWRVCDILSASQGMSSDYRFDEQWHTQAVACLCELSLPAFDLMDGGAVDLAHQAVMVLLAFLVGVQDNSLLLARHEMMLSALARQARLLGIVWTKGADDGWVRLIERTHDLTITDWVALMNVVAGQVNMAKRCLQTLETAFLYDGTINQTEQDILAIFKTILQ